MVIFANEVDEQKPSVSASPVVIDIQYSGWTRERKRKDETDTFHQSAVIAIGFRPERRGKYSLEDEI